MTPKPPGLDVALRKIELKRSLRQDLIEESDRCRKRARQCRNPAYKSYWEGQARLLAEKADEAADPPAIGPNSSREMLTMQGLIDESLGNHYSQNDLDELYDKIEERNGSVPVLDPNRDGAGSVRSSFLGQRRASYGHSSASSDRGSRGSWLTVVGGQWPR